MGILWDFQFLIKGRSVNVHFPWSPGEHAQLLRPMEGGKNPPNLFVVGGVGDLPMVTKKPTTKLGQKSTVVGSILLFGAGWWFVFLYGILQHRYFKSPFLKPPIWGIFIFFQPPNKKSKWLTRNKNRQDFPLKVAWRSPGEKFSVVFYNDFAHIPWEDTPNFPKPPKRKNSFINCWWNIRGTFQGYVGEILVVFLLKKAHLPHFHCVFYIFFWKKCLPFWFNSEKGRFCFHVIHNSYCFCWFMLRSICMNLECCT